MLPPVASELVPAEIATEPPMPVAAVPLETMIDPD